MNCPTCGKKMSDALRRERNPEAIKECIAALERISFGAECTCSDGAPGFVCDACEARAALAKFKGVNIAVAASVVRDVLVELYDVVVGTEVFVIQIDTLRLARVEDFNKSLTLVTWQNGSGATRKRRVRLTGAVSEWYGDCANRFGLIRGALTPSQDDRLMKLVGHRMNRNVLDPEGVTR